MITWVTCPLTDNTRSACGRYRIVRTSTGWRLYARATEFERPLMTGTESECRDLATELEDPAWQDGLELEPLVVDAAVPEPGATLVRMAARIAVSGGRLETLLARRCPRELLQLELSILTKWAARLAARAKTLTADSLT